MPWIGAAASNGLKLSVRLSSGEDSMTRAAGWSWRLALPLPLLELLALEYELLGRAGREARRKERGGDSRQRLSCLGFS